MKEKSAEEWCLEFLKKETPHGQVAGVLVPEFVTQIQLDTRRVVLEEAIKICDVQAANIYIPSPIGPLHAAGMVTAYDYMKHELVERLRTLPTERKEGDDT